MHKFIQTFYLWLGLFTFCNVMSTGAVMFSRGLSWSTLMLFPVGWVLQFPLVLIIAAIHHGFNRAFRWLPAAHKKPVRFVLCALCAFLFIGTYTASQIMYLAIDSYISLDAFRVAAGNFHQIIPDIARGMGLQLTVVAVVAIIFSIIHTRRYHGQPAGHSPRVFALACALFLSTGAGGFALVYRSSSPVADQVRRDLLPTTFLAMSILDDLTSPGVQRADFLKDLVMEPRVSMEEYLAECPLENRPNVFFIMLESISWDRYGFTGYERDVSPNLDALAEQSVVFTRTYAAAPHSNYAQTSVHAAQYPLRRKKLDTFWQINYPKTMLFDIFGAAGYETAFFSAQNEDWLGMRDFIQTDCHMDHFFHSKNELGEHIGIESKVDDELVRTRAVEYLEARDVDQPIFMYLNFQATHFPYEVPDGAEQPFQPSHTDDFNFEFFNYDAAYVDRVVNRFDNAMRYVDARVGLFIEHLKDQGLYDNSVIVVTSDHGEAFYERGYPTHGTALFEDQMRVAFLIKPPGGTKAVVRADPISIIDVNPTVLEVLGWPNHPNFQGQQVLHNERVGPIHMVCHGVIKSRGLLDWPWKYIDSEKDGEWLLNLERDPTEWEDYSETDPAELARLKQEMLVYQQRQLYYYLMLSQADRDALYPPRH